MGPNEAALMKVFDARPAQMRQQARAWKKGADDLRLVAERLRTKKSQLKEAWPAGEDGEAATAAFEALATYVDSQAGRMDQGKASYETAAQAITDARGNWEKLPDVPDGGGALGDSATPQQVQAADKANASGKAAREQKAGEFLQQMDNTFRDAQSQMAQAAPYDSGVTGGETGTKDQGYGGSGAGSYSSPGSGGSGPYSTSTAGTYAGGMVGASALGGRPLLGGVRPITGPGRPGQVVGGDGSTADGVVGGTVPGGEASGGGSAGAGGATVGGGAGLGGGTGTAMGAGGAAALVGGGKGLLGKLGGAGAAKGGVSGGSATARSAGSAATAKGATIGGRSAGGSQGVLGGRGGSASGASAQGARGATAGGQQAGRGAGAGGRSGGTAGRTAGSPSTARSAGSSAGGRSSGAAGAKGAPGSNAAGSRSSGSAGRSGTGSGGGRGTGPGGNGQSGRGAQRGSEDKAAKRKAMVMAEDWMDDDDVAPDVLQ